MMPVDAPENAVRRPVSRWYLLMVKPRQEVSAQVNLERQGYEVFYPRIRVDKRRAGKKEAHVEPLFPRYMFIRLNQSDDWGPIRSTIGVAGLVRFGVQPALVADSIIESVRGRVDDDGILEMRRPELIPGDDVKVESGPFEGFTGKVVSLSAKERINVLLDLAGQSIKVQMNESLITAVPGAAIG